MEIKLIKGGIAVDDRGAVSFVNDFNFQDVKRFYMIENHKRGFVRAWHGHKKEGKYFFVAKGAAIVCGVEIDDWDNPSKNLKVNRYILSDVSPSILYMPAGYANGSMTLSKNTKIMVFSNSSIDESLNDDIRFDSRYWNPWEVIER